LADDSVVIEAGLVQRLIAMQFPRWSDLPIRPVSESGWDNHTFRLGDAMAVRLPSAAWYAPQVEKEHRWLPRLAAHLPLPIPAPLAMGAPADGYPWHWSINRWLPGESASTGRIADRSDFAIATGEFLAALQRINPADGPPPGPHNFYRGGPLTTYDVETRRALAALEGKIDTVAATRIWEAALRATWRGTPVWLHGDVSPGNLLVNAGRMSAVIDFGCCGVGDPACDLALAWTFLKGPSRQAFRSAVRADDATWARGRAWALWKASIQLAEQIETKTSTAESARNTLAEILHDHGLGGNLGM
jgi:aminoglycoside phosphotransferase (APT) family kinase protein